MRNISLDFNSQEFTSIEQEDKFYLKTFEYLFGLLDKDKMSTVWTESIAQYIQVNTCILFSRKKLSCLNKIIPQMNMNIFIKGENNQAVLSLVEYEYITGQSKEEPNIFARVVRLKKQKKYTQKQQKYRHYYLIHFYREEDAEQYYMREQNKITNIKLNTKKRFYTSNLITEYLHFQCNNKNEEIQQQQNEQSQQEDFFTNDRYENIQEQPNQQQQDEHSKKDDKHELSQEQLNQQQQQESYFQQAQQQFQNYQEFLQDSNDQIDYQQTINEGGYNNNDNDNNLNEIEDQVTKRTKTDEEEIQTEFQEKQMEIILELKAALLNEIYYKQQIKEDFQSYKQQILNLQWKVRELEKQVKTNNNNLLQQQIQKL